jgi:DNA-binding MarR family transcriptional regulator
MYREALLSSGAITNRIDGVERRGWVKRHRDPDDRRGTIVRLTPAGKAVADKAIELHFRELAKLLAGLSREEREQMSVLLAKLLGLFETDDANADLSGNSHAGKSRHRRKS